MTCTITHCGLCGGNALETVLSLGESPPTCRMVPVGEDTSFEQSHPLELLRCAGCTLVQLSTIVDPSDVFPPDYPYSSGNSRGLHANFADLAREATHWAGLTSSDLVVDIGANDGTLLSKFHCRTVGVEPTGQARRIRGPAYQEFFTQAVARRIRDEHGPARVVTACNVLAHVEDIDDVMEGIRLLLADGGLLIAENHDLRSVVDGQWDTVYHEHLRFYSPYTFHLLLAKHGMTGRVWQDIPTHGGSFRVFAGKGARGQRPALPHHDFARVAREAEATRSAIREAVAAGGTVGIGATARATTIINYCGLDVGDLEYVCEVPGSDKIGHYIPGTRIPVVNEERLFDEQPDRAVLFSWHLADSIVPKLRERGYDGEIILPLPTLTAA
jgi:hypothetical protein